MPSEPNFRKLKISRKWPEPGDIFCLLMIDGLYLFGRVINIALEREGPGYNDVLIYIYDERSSEKSPPMEALVPSRLLIPPVFTNRRGWTMGFWETVASQPLTRFDMLRQHCFRRFDDVFFDEAGNRLFQRHEPCGDWAIKSYRAIDDLVSEALGIPLAPVAPDD